MGLSVREMAKYIGISTPMLHAVEAQTRGVGIRVGKKIQAKSAEYALKHADIVRESGLALPIRCEDW